MSIKAGQILAQIDDRDFKVALDQAKADVAAAQAAIDKQAGPARGSAGGDQRRKGDHRCRPGRVTFAAQENKRYTDLAATGYRQRAECAAGAMRAIAGARRRDRARYRQPRLGVKAGRSAQRRDRRKPAAAAARPSAPAPGRAQSRLHHHYLRRSTAWSATARCAPASSCRPARS